MTEPESARAAVAGRAIERGLALACGTALAVTLLMAAPVLWAPSSRLFGTEIVGRNHDPFTAMERFARPPSLGWYSQPATDWPGALLARLMGPVATYNLIVLASFPLSAATAYLLAHHLTGSTAGSVVAALAYAFSPFHLAHSAYHVHIAQTQWLPLYLLALFRCLDHATVWRAALLLGSVALLVLSNFYAGFIGAVLTPLCLLGYWLSVPTPRRGLGALIVTSLVLAVTAAGGFLYLRLVTAEAFRQPALLAFPRADLFRYAAKWWAYLLPPVEHPALGDWARAVWQRHGVGGAVLEQQVFVGWSLLALGLVPVWQWWRGHRQHRAVRLVPLLGGLALAALLCSLSPERRIGSVTVVRPAAYLYELAPMFRAYARFGLVVQLIAALLAGAGVAWLAGRPGRSSRAAVLALLAVLVVEYAPFPPWRWRDVLPTQGHRWLASQPPPVRVLDCVRPTPPERSVLWLLGHDVSLLERPFADCEEPNLGQKLTALGYTHALLRSARSSRGAEAAVYEAHGLRVVREFGDSRVLAVVAVKPPVFTAEFIAFEARRTEGQWSWRRMTQDGAWRVVNTSPRAVRAMLEAELSPGTEPQRLETSLDGRPGPGLLIPAGYHHCRIGPLSLPPGDSVLVFRARSASLADAPALPGPGPHRSSLAIGTWRWWLPASDEGGGGCRPRLPTDSPAAPGVRPTP